MNILMILAQEGFQDQEYERPRSVFEENGANVFTSSLQKGKAIGKYGLEIDIDYSLDEITDSVIKQLDAVVTVGGSGTATLGVQKYFDIIKKAWEENKIIGSICAAPALLAAIGLLNGKRCTCTQSQIKYLEQKFANYIDEPVVVDGKLITAQGPDTAVDFGNQILKVIKEH